MEPRKQKNENKRTDTKTLRIPKKTDLDLYKKWVVLRSHPSFFLK